MRAALIMFGVLSCSGVEAATPIPVCQNERQCEAMWAAAVRAIGAATGMPIRLVSDTRIETHPATNATQLTGAATKVLSGQEGYKIVVDLSCYESTVKCDDLVRSATEIFNTLVTNAGVGFGPLPEANPLERKAFWADR
jgi:hypothetical protein